METLTDLNPAVPSKHANIYYLEHCRVMERNGRVRYLYETENEFQYGNIPINKPTTILLGAGTSISQVAMGRLANAGVMVGINSDATDLLTGTETEWLMPTYEERPSQYLQGWLAFCFDDHKRIDMAKQLQQARIHFMKTVWMNNKRLIAEGLNIFDDDIYRPLNKMSVKIDAAKDIKTLLKLESEFTQRMYKIGDYRTRYGYFMRDKHATDKVNMFLNHGYYLANGLAACALWVLGIPHDFSVMHEKHRRNALVLDIAKSIKDALVLPWAFICAKENMTQQEFREACLQVFAEYKAFDFMFDQVTTFALQHYQSKGDAA